ncbi:right-handed parallel beta-helix repeat-containing protein [Seonamhaeicola aphaedonensis]|uniref:Parallel beta helix pectate lyase-like protein n=1 Tax=Seonamhaeicola aphaedonensis TaxID=1461338 RepID=A0A3D9H5G7_9FLAO|nr:right-handed parallel beta-helix repeat-containing protein [Seonamhaeicola aphaedonensis]RED44734.1 hypothetical protein DFQ02_11037 [Seonamhaeicola aphaedonensis]
MKKIIYITTIALLILTSCSNEEVILENEQGVSNTAKSINSKSLADAIVVAPSNDMTGVTDADNIEAALNEAKATGGTVYLSDGLMNTKDSYYVSRTIRVEGFNGAFLGEHKDKTMIHAGRKSDSEGFSPGFSTARNSPVAHIFQFDKPTDHVTIKNMTVLVKDDQPSEVYNGNTFLGVAFELIGGHFNTTIEKIRIEGNESSADGNLFGYNLNWGLHVMPWGDGPMGGPPPRTQGTLTIKNIDIENLATQAITFMDYRDGSEVLINNIIAKNVGVGLVGERINDSNVLVENFKATPHNRITAPTMIFWGIESGVTITDSKIENSQGRFSIMIRNSPNSTIANTTIKNSNNVDATILLNNSSHSKVTNTSFINCNAGRAAIRIFNATDCSIIQNDYRESGLPGWTETSNGPGALLIHGNVTNTYVYETMFPLGLTVCDMVNDNGSNTSIHNWEACIED